MRWWLRSLGVGAAVGFVCGFVVGGVLGRVYMRVLFLVDEDTSGIETAFGAIVGEVTLGGTLFLFGFGGFVGIGLGLAYVVLRVLMPPAIVWREAIFVVAATLVMLPIIVRANLDDFSFLPVTLSLVLIAASIAVTAIPVPLLVERFATDRARSPRTLGYGVLGLGIVGLLAFASSAVVDAYAVEPIF